MSAVLKTQEPSARYLAALRPPLVEQFDLVASAPGGVARLRELILTLAVRGKLVPQAPDDEPASALLTQVRSEKMQLVADGKIKQAKPVEDISPAEIPFNLPSGWIWVRLGTLLQKIGSGSTPLGGKEVYVPSGIKFLRSQNVWNDGLRVDGVAFITPTIHAQMAGTVVRANDLLFNITGASIGRCAVVPDDFDEANVSQHVTILRPVLKALNPYLHKVMISRRVQQSVMDVQVGVSREGLSVAKLGRFLIPLPPLAEQSRIVARVADLMRLCDALEAQGRLEDAQHAQVLDFLLGTLTDSGSPAELEANWQRFAARFDLLLDRPEAVDALEQTILRLAVRGLLIPEDDQSSDGVPKSPRVRSERLLKDSASKADGRPPRSGGQWRLPDSWQRVRLGDVCSLITDGEHATPERCIDSTAVPLVTAKNVRSEAMDYGQTDFVPVAVAEQCWRRCKPAVGDILMVSVGATLGRLCVLQEARDMVLVRSVTVIRPVQNIVNVSYLALHLMSPDSQADIWSSVKQSAQPCLYLAKSAALNIALPPLTEQGRIVARVNELRRLCAALRARLVAQQTTQTHLTESLVESAAAA